MGAAVTNQGLTKLASTQPKESKAATFFIHKLYRWKIRKYGVSLSLRVPMVIGVAAPLELDLPLAIAHTPNLSQAFFRIKDERGRSWKIEHQPENVSADAGSDVLKSSPGQPWSRSPVAGWKLSGGTRPSWDHSKHRGLSCYRTWLG